MNNPLFSVLIANYNNGIYIEDAIQSIFDQTYNNWEIIIVDDFSTDSSLDAYESYQKNEKIKVFRNAENKGCGYTKRRCVDEASGLICGFLDPDDILSKDALAEMIAAHEQNPDCSLIHSKLYFCDEKLEILGEYSAAKNVPFGEKMFFNMHGEFTAFASFKKSFYDKTDGIDSYLIRAVDQDLYYKLYETGKTFFLDKFLYYYRVHNSGISTLSNSDKAYYWKWFTILSAAKRRGINIEDFFLENFVTRYEYEMLKNKYEKVKKYSKLNDFLRNIKHKFGLIK